MTKSEVRFLFLSRLTLIMIFLVILAGSVVRMTGSGMGCPDWPKCFGQWIPPTDVSQLPEDYKEVYSAQRAEKIADFSGFLESIGFKDEAEQIRADKTLMEEEDFNARKTWTEYINRLVGFLAGNLVLLSVIWSLFLFRKNRWLFVLSFLNLVLIMFTAWFGAMVVATNLLPWTISVHMGIALIIVSIQIVLNSKASNSKFRLDATNTYILFLAIAILVSFVQIILGTQVRQQIDVINDLSGGMGREGWIEQTGAIFLVHRSFSILVLLVNGVMFYQNWRYRMSIHVTNLLLVIILLEVFSGMILAYLGVPRFAQPLHLMLSCIMLGIQVYIATRVRKSRKVFS